MCLPKQTKMKIGETVLRFFSRVALLSRSEAYQLWSGVTATAGVIECGDVSCYRWSERGPNALAQCLAVLNVKFAQTFGFTFPIRCRKLCRCVRNLSRQETNKTTETTTTRRRRKHHCIAPVRRRVLHGFMPPVARSTSTRGTCWHYGRCKT